jgi:hypothetical protein
MAEIDCWHAFFSVHHTSDEPIYDAAFAELRRLAADGLIRGRFRVSVGERQGSSQVFATIWSAEPSVVAGEWQYAAGEEGLPHSYTRGFNPAATTPTDIVAAVKEMLLASSAS